MLLPVFFFNLSIWFDLISDPDHTQLRQVKVQKIICWKVKLIWPIKERVFFWKWVRSTIRLWLLQISWRISQYLVLFFLEGTVTNPAI